LVSVATWAFFYSVKNGQFDDLESPAHRILFDDDDDMIPEDARVKKTDEEKPNE
jgi:cbb3-type cytochrome oxidase maturation protein